MNPDTYHSIVLICQDIRLNATSEQEKEKCFAVQRGLLGLELDEKTHGHFLSDLRFNIDRLIEEFPTKSKPSMLEQYECTRIAGRLIKKL